MKDLEFNLPLCTICSTIHISPDDVTFEHGDDYPMFYEDSEVVCACGREGVLQIGYDNDVYAIFDDEESVI